MYIGDKFVLDVYAHFVWKYGILVGVFLIFVLLFNLRANSTTFYMYINKKEFYSGEILMYCDVYATNKMGSSSDDWIY
jgi:hypothetical protein